MRYSTIKKDLKKKIKIFNTTEGYLELYEYIFNLSIKSGTYYNNIINTPSLHDLKKLKLILEDFWNYDDAVLILINQAIYYAKLTYKRILIHHNFSEHSCKKIFSNDDKNYINALIIIKLKSIKKIILNQNFRKNNHSFIRQFAIKFKDFSKTIKFI